MKMKRDVNDHVGIKRRLVMRREENGKKRKDEDKMLKRKSCAMIFL